MNEQRPQVYRQLLQELLQATASSNGDAQAIYPLLAANTEILNDTFVEVLRSWSTHALTNVQSHEVRFIGEVINNFSSLFNQFSLGSKAKNLEIAIAGYEIAQTLYTRSAFPIEWATTQNNLGNVYSQRILGEREQNIEKAIASYSAALEVYTSSGFPQEWAMTQHNLGYAYFERILGEPEQNIEKAIAAYSAALEVYNHSDFPLEWATTLNNLGNAYSDRILGEPEQNIEKAIAAYSAALEVYTSSDFPQEWATTHNNLGNAYFNRILGEPEQNIEKAIAAYAAALSVYNRSDFPQDWATAQNNLGNAYFKRVSGERVQNIEKALAAYSAALEVYTRSSFPVEWAMTQNNLGNAYSNRILGERANNIEKAIGAYSAALEVLTSSGFPQDWAMTQNNLGNAYSNRILGEREQNIEKAIAAYSAALSVYNRSDFPQDWAMTQNSLGNAYSNRILGERTNNIEKAIAAYSAALEVLNRSSVPDADWATRQNNLGNSYFDRLFSEQVDKIENDNAADAAKIENDSAADAAKIENGKAAYFAKIENDSAAYFAKIENDSAADAAKIENGKVADAAKIENGKAAYFAKIENDSAADAAKIKNGNTAYFDAPEVYNQNGISQNSATTQNNLRNTYAGAIFNEQSGKSENLITPYSDELKDSSISTKSTLKIYAPSIHLFAFQLDKSSNIDISDLSINKNFLWEKGDEIISKTLRQDLRLSQRIDVNKELNSNHADLSKDQEVIGDSYTSFSGKVPFGQNQELLIKGFAYPLRIDDSYCLWLNLRRPEQEDNNPTPDVDISFLRQLNPNNCLTFKESSSFIGQTLLITGWLTRAKDKKFVKQIAEECLTAIFPDNYKLPPFNSQGELFGSPIFEYGVFSQLANYQHVIIWLFNDGEADNSFNQCYEELLDLFSFRSKVVKTFKDSREICKQLNSAYQQIESTIVQLPKIDNQNSSSIENLAGLKNQIQSLLQMSLTYTSLLRNLEEYQNTIAINTYNYREKLQQILGIFPDEDINFLETFSQSNCPGFQQQINADLGYFRYGSELLSRAIDSIRTIVEIEHASERARSLEIIEIQQAERSHSLEIIEIEQAECVRSLERVEREQAERARSLKRVEMEQAERARFLDSTIHALGIGLGGGGIFSVIVNHNIDKISQPIPFISPNHPPNPFYLSLTLNIIFTFGFMTLGWLIAKRKYSPKNHRYKETREG